MFVYVFAVYLLLINFVAAILYAVDKKRAVQHKWRIREATLLGIAAIGGSVGSLLSMHLFHHKTRKWYFAIGVPAMLIIQIAVVLLLQRYHIVSLF